MKALCDCAQVDRRSLSPWHIGFVIGPRLNAAGRMAHGGEWRSEEDWPIPRTEHTCFFLSKEMLYPGSRFRMADELLEAYTQQYIAAQRVPEVTFAWQGGEPTLMGLDFFQLALHQFHHLVYSVF